MIADTVSGDDDFIGQLRAFGSGGEHTGSLVIGEAGSLQEALGGLDGGNVLVLGAHVSGVDGVAVHVHGEGHAIALVGRLGSSPGGGGDGVVDDGRSIAIVGIHGGVAVHSQHGGQSLAQVLGGLGAGLASNVHGVGVHADVAIAQVGHGVGGHHVAGHFAVAVEGAQHLEVGLGAVHLAAVSGAGLHSGSHFSRVGFLVLEGLDDGFALEVVGIRLVVHDAVLILDELVGAGAHGSVVLGGHRRQIAVGMTKVVGVVVIGAVAIVVLGGDGQAADAVHSGSGEALHLHFDGVVVQLLDTGDVGHASGEVNTGSLGQSGHGLGVQIVGGGAGGRLGAQVGLDVAAVGREGAIEVVVNGGEGLSHVVDLAVGVGEGAVLVHSAEAPQSHAQGGLQAVGGTNLVHGLAQRSLSIVRTVVVEHVVDDALHVSLPQLGQLAVVGVVLLLGEQVTLSHGVAEASGLQGVHHGHNVAQRSLGNLGHVSLQADDGIAAQGGGAGVAGIQIHIVGEDDVIRGDRLAVGELQVLTDLGGVGGDVIGLIVHHGDICGAGVEVVGAVVAHRLTLDGVVDDAAHTVGGHHADLGQFNHVLVVTGVGEEGAELGAQRGNRHNQGRAGSFLSEGSGDAGEHARSQQQSQQLFHGLFLLFVIPAATAKHCIRLQGLYF